MINRELSALIATTPELLLRKDLCAAAGDPKLGAGAGVPVYIPLPDYDRVRGGLSNPAQARPFDAARDAAKFAGGDAPHGLLYLPFPYLVPGGRFNEMYGWDSAFPVFAWTEERPETMRMQVDNQLYQIRMYGKVLNANRTYYLSRSQPPLIAAMTLHVWRKTREDAWLAAAFRDLEAYHRYWTTGERLAPGLALSRYWDDGDVPAPEVISGEEGHFSHALAHFRQGDPDAALFLDDRTGALTPAYYRADRAMRASGFDPTGHWGYGALRCMFHAPVCLNSLLYRMETDMAEIAGVVGQDASAWTKRAQDRKAAMRALMFDGETGLYHDYDFMARARNVKPFASIFHAFWAGLYDGAPDDAQRAAEVALAKLETPFGIATSIEKSGSQWDWPYGWPPMQYFAFAGLKRCGLDADAKRVAEKFASLAARVFESNSKMFEKYNVAEGNAEIRVVHGYHENVSESGTFLWTAAVLKMAAELL
jgi:alpha,alpha-trehalase